MTLCLFKLREIDIQAPGKCLFSMRERGVEQVFFVFVFGVYFRYVNMKSIEKFSEE